MAKQKFVKKFIKRKLFAGSEPEVTNLTKEDLIHVLYWYNKADFSEKQKRKWAVEYFNDKSLLKINEKWFNHTAVHVCRMISRGYIPTDSDEEYINNFRVDVKKRIEPKVKAIEKKGPSIQDRMLEQVQPVLAEIDFFVDEILQGKENQLGDLIVNFGRPQTKHVINHIQSYIDDFNNNQDDYGLKTRGKNKIVKYLESLKEECNKLVQAKNRVRKIRVKKQKSPIEICKNVKVAEDSIFRPTKVLTSSYVVLYNKLRGKVTMLVADSSDGLFIKGTSIVNYSESKSKVFSVKDENFIKQIPSTITKLKNFMSQTKSLRESKGKITGKVSGRISDNINIVMVI